MDPHWASTWRYVPPAVGCCHHHARISCDDCATCSCMSYGIMEAALSQQRVSVTCVHYGHPLRSAACIHIPAIAPNILVCADSCMQPPLNSFPYHPLLPCMLPCAGLLPGHPQAGRVGGEPCIGWRAAAGTGGRGSCINTSTHSCC
jgi:hypothetical protein